MGMYQTLKSVIRFKPLELDPVARRLAKAADVDDLRKIAKRRLPHGVFDYIDGAAEDERTYGANTEAYRRRTFRPRVLRDVSNVDPSTTLLGRRIPLPLVLAPTGFARIADPEGELAVARAAAKVGAPVHAVDHRHPLDRGDRRGQPRPKWFQLYVFRDRGLTKELVERTEGGGLRGHHRSPSTPPSSVAGSGTSAGASRSRPRSGWARSSTAPSTPAGPGPSSGPSRSCSPTWPARTWATAADAVSLADYINGQFDPSLSWADVEWLRSIWDGPLVIKGIQTVADAEIAADAGVEAVALSNHGGRQLDTAPATLDLVEPVVRPWATGSRSSATAGSAGAATS